MKLSIRDLCFIPCFTAIIAVMAQISFPLAYGVPITLQTFAILLAGIVLGAKKGAISVLIYILLGAVGVPVFAGFNGGFGIFLGPTSGFLISFPIMAYLAGVGASKGGVRLAAWLVAGVLINYFCGMIMFSFIMGQNIYFSFAVCVLPYICPDIIKLILAGFLGTHVRKILFKKVSAHYR